MGFFRGPNIVTEGLIMALDAASPRCVTATAPVLELADITRVNTGISAIGTTVGGNGHFYFRGQGETDGSPTGDYIEVPTAPTQVQAHDQGITYEIWLNPDANRRMALFWGSGTIRHVEAYAGTAGGQFRTEASVQNGYSFGASAPPGGIPLNTWSMLNIAWGPEGSTREVKWYWNGELFYTHSNFYSGTAGTGEDFYFSGLGRATGSSAYLYATSWSGFLNGLKIYSKTLSATEIAQNFEAQRFRYGV